MFFKVLRNIVVLAITLGIGVLIGRQTDMATITAIPIPRDVAEGYKKVYANRSGERWALVSTKDPDGMRLDVQQDRSIGYCPLYARMHMGQRKLPQTDSKGEPLYFDIVMCERRVLPPT